MGLNSSRLGLVCPPGLANPLPLRAALPIWQSIPGNRVALADRRIQSLTVCCRGKAQILPNRPCQWIAVRVLLFGWYAIRLFRRTDGENPKTWPDRALGALIGRRPLVSLRMGVVKTRHDPSAGERAAPTPPVLLLLRGSVNKHASLPLG